MSINYSKAVDYWEKFFPESYNKTDIEQLLKKTSNTNFEKLKFKWENTEESLEHENLIEEILSYNQLDSEINEIIENFSHTDFQYINFISPLLFYVFRKAKHKLPKFQIIQDKNLFLQNIIVGCYASTYNIFIKTIILEINVAKENGWLEGDTSESRGDNYRHVLLKNMNYIKELYLEYSSLVNLLISTLENYIDYIYDIIEATKIEKPLLETCFRCNLGNIINIETSFGDSHSGGKTVAIIQFTTGIKLVVKPREMLLEKNFNQFIKKINESSEKGLLDLRYAKVHTAQNFSWMEFIEHKSCSINTEVSDFYKRIGQFLCILYTLNARDFHHENLIASGKDPVLIDLEALLHIGKQEEHGESVHDLALDIIDDSVYSIYLLPTRSMFSEKDGKVNAFDIGGVGASEKQLSPFKTPKIINNHTDSIKIKKDYDYVAIENNNPRLNGEIIQSENFINEIHEGFFNMYSWILNNKNQYLRYVKEFFSEVNTRIIARPTFLYAELLSISYHPDLLRNNIDREVFINRIGIPEPFIDNNNILFNEYSDLLAGDIPYFSVNSKELVLRNSYTEVISGLKLKNSPLDVVIQKINNLCLEDMNFQQKIIDFTFMHTISNVPNTTGVQFNKTNNFTKTADKRDYLNISMKIADKMIEDSITNSNGTERTWFGLMIIGKEEAFTRFSSIEYDLYKGNSGIALFYAYLADATGEKKYKEIALQTIKSCVDLLESLNEQPEVDDLGAFTGLSGIIYSVFHLGDILGINKYKELAYISSNYLVENIKNCREFDIISGCSGALAVLLSLYEKTSDDKIKQRLMNNSSILSKHIINNTTKYGDMELWGTYENNEGYTGFAHGTSGITSTLIRYYKHKKDPRVLEVIKRALKFENHLFSTETNNWKMSVGDNAKSVAWCHGAAGILLNRALMLKHGYEDKEIIMIDIKNALETSITYGFGANYVLCHGDTGNLASVYQLAEVLDDGELKEYCDNTLDELLNKYVKNNWNKNTFRSANMYGLMIGLAGLGYFMLKYGCNKNMPNILWLE